MVALIPARAGSKRIPGKNSRPFCGVPLWRYAVAAARASGLFSDRLGDVVVSTDDPTILEAYHPDAYVLRRPAHLAQDTAADIYWVKHALTEVWGRPPSGMSAMSAHRDVGPPDAFAILRPTSPFRTAETIRRAYRLFTVPDQTADTLRAVEPVAQHPGKMWTWPGKGYPMKPLLDDLHPDGTPWHSSPTQTLPPYYVQNACLEMAWTYVVRDYGTITGRKILPFLTEGYEGVDLNTEEDWTRAEALVANGLATLPAVDLARV